MRYAFRRRQLHRQARFESIVSTRRQLRLEPLEVRQMLDASAWTNPANALDVDGDGFIVGTDALIIVNRLNDPNANNKLPDLEEGTTPDFWYDPNGDGFCTAADVLAIADRLNALNANLPPVLTVALANDTGPSGIPNNDNITKDPTVAGTVSDAGPLVFFTASINNLPDPVSLKSIIQPNGTFTITNSVLEQLYGGPLVDGAYELHLTAVNELGFTTSKTFSMTLDRNTFTPLTPDLTTASDTGFSSFDNITKLTAPEISVVAEVGSLVTLFVDGTPLVQQVVASPIAIFNLAGLTDGVHEITAQSVDGAGNLSSVSPVLEVTIRTVAPVVNMITVPYQDDLTPMYKGEITSNPNLPNGTPIYVDVDRNNDGDYDDTDELGAGQATIYNKTASVHLTNPLVAAIDTQVPIKVRMRVLDEAGNEGIDEVSQLVDLTVSNVLKNYVNKDDGAYAIGTVQEIAPGQSGFKVYTVQMTSQQWRTAADVDKPIWKHWVTFIVPTNVTKSTAFINITGGSNTSSQPTTIDSTLTQLAQFALLTQSVVINLPQVPSQPLVFTADETPGRQRTEDEVIAYSYDEFLKNPSDTDWPVLQAMVKAAVKTMDTAQKLVNETEDVPVNFTGGATSINDFVITGGSKRGWTTWLVPAVDDRVRAIIPTVFDALNLDEQMQHHFGVYGFFSPAIQDYEDEHVFDRMLTENGSKLGAIVDPYHYIVTGNGNYNIPKYAIVSAGDQFFVSDSSQYYFQDLPGTQNYLRYVPNTGHGLNQDAVIGAATFYNAILKNQVLPKFSWTIQDDHSIVVSPTDIPLKATLWQSTNPFARDWRQTYTDTFWTSTQLTLQPDGTFVGNVPIPANGATAFFVELTYSSGQPTPFIFTTDMSVQTNLPLYPWPFEIADPVPASASLAAASLVGDGSLADALGATSFAASLPAESAAMSLATLLPAAAPLATPALSAPSQAQETARDEALAAISFSSGATAAADDSDEDSSSALADSIFDDELFDPTGDLEELLALL